MIHYVNNCKDCPMLEYDGEGYGTCQHPKSRLKDEHYNLFPEDSIHELCPLKTIDLILTIRER